MRWVLVLVCFHERCCGGGEVVGVAGAVVLSALVGCCAAGVEWGEGGGTISRFVLSLFLAFVVTWGETVINS